MADSTNPSYLLRREIDRLKAELQDLESSTAQRMIDTYRGVTYEIMTRLREMVAWNIANPDAEQYSQFQIFRLQQQLEDARQQFAAFTAQSAAAIEQVQLASVAAAWASATSMLEIIDPRGGFAANIDNAGLQTLVATLGEGSPVRKVLNSYGEFAADVIERELTSSFALGTGMPAALDAIADQINGGVITSRMRALVRTETMRAAREAQLQNYEENGVDQWEWVASRSQWTCLACLAMDGRKFPITTRFERAHVQCRCTPAPVPDSEYWDDTGDSESAAEWFAQQPDFVQRRMMPSQAAFNAYKGGALSLDDFVGDTFSETWGPSIIERSGKQAFESKGLDWRDWTSGPSQNSGGSNPSVDSSNSTQTEDVSEIQGIYQGPVQYLALNGSKTPGDAEIERFYTDVLGVPNVSFSSKAQKKRFVQIANYLSELKFRFAGEMPSAVLSDPSRDYIMAHSEARPSGDRKLIVSVSNRDYWSDLAGQQKKLFDKGWFSSTYPGHAPYHEMVHWWHRTTRSSPLTKARLSVDEQKLARKHVSGYAAYNESEFVAETLTAALAGFSGRVDDYQFPPEIWRLYYKFGGPEVPGVTPEPDTLKEDGS